MSSAGHPPAPGCQGAGSGVPGGYGHDGHQHGGTGGGGGGGGHSHRPGPGADARYLVVALVLLAAFMAAEVIVAVLSGSLALLSDAGHMLSDVGAIGAALWAIRLAARPPGPGRSAGSGPRSCPPPPTALRCWSSAGSSPSKRSPG